MLLAVMRTGMLCTISLRWLLGLVLLAFPFDARAEDWSEVVPGVLRSAGIPCSYAVIDGDAALLIGAAWGVDLPALEKLGIAKVERVLLTHHHRDSLARAAELMETGAQVSAPQASAGWITPDGVRTFWQVAMPEPSPAGREPPLKERTFNDWVYLVLPEGIPGVDVSLSDGQRIVWRSWRITCIATPGHSRDHMAYAAERIEPPADGQTDRVIFCGDALCAPGKIPTPYTTDWEHWSGRGLHSAFESLRRLASLDPAVLCPEHGPPIHEHPATALYETAMNVAEAAFLKSYERYTKERLGNPPGGSFLARQQVITAGDEPWTALTPHLFLTGNTFAVASRDGPVMLFDAYGPLVVQQVKKLQADQQLGAVEVVTISHAHNDHYKGIYLLPEREKFQVWTEARVAEPLAQPYRFCAPYVDARPLKIDRTLKDGERFRWHEYEFVAHHLPGQTDFAMGLEATIDGKKCFFTGDNFYHADQFSGSGGWSGRNRGLPLPYAASARKILAAAPDWVLAEHGGAFQFDAEDFSRRARWAEEAATAADALSPSGDHRHDWDPQQIRVEPLLQRAKPGQSVRFTLLSDQPVRERETLAVSLAGRGIVGDWSETVEIPQGQAVRQEITLRVASDTAPGQHVLPLLVLHGDEENGADTFCVVDVRPPER